MQLYAEPQALLVERLWPSREHNRVLRGLVVALLGSLLMTLSAKVQVPFYPVPMTLQTAAAFLLGITLGWRLAVASVLLYLAQGALGLPVFAGTPAKGIGLAYMAGPTGGYLMGFVAAAAITGWIAERRRGLVPTALGVALATLAVYALGVAWLGTLIGYGQAVTLGVLPFLLGDLFKLALVTALAEAGLPRLARRR